MGDYVLISDGSCDLTLEEATVINVDVVPFYVTFGEEKQFKEGLDYNVREFYQKMVDNPNIFPKTSLPSPQDYMDAFEKHLKNGKDIICMCITSKFSGSYNSARNAAEILLEDYPERRITVIDTMVNTVLQGLIVREAARMRDLGTSYDALVDMINENKLTGRILFTLNGLSYLQHGGRIGKLSSIIGDLLKISPIICLKDGEIFNDGKVMFRKRALVKVRENVLKHLEECQANKDEYRLVVGYGYDIEEAKEFKSMMEKALPGFDILFQQIGATIGVHTGPHPLGVGLVKIFK